jgi:hypothetical protein
MSKNRLELQKQGYLVLRNVFDNDELKKIKDFAVKHDHDGSVENFRCLLSLSGSSCLFKNKKIGEILTDLMPAKPVYYGDSSLTVNKGESLVNEGSGQYHKDCADRADFNAPDWTSPEPYSLIRMGIYLDDYSKKSGGIAFRKRSHKPEWIRKKLDRKPLIYLLHLWDMIVGRAYYSAPQVGDLVLWYMSTDHAGNAKYIKPFPSMAITKYTNFFPSFLVSPANHVTRRVLFLAFGQHDCHTERYILQNKARDFMINTWLKSKYDKECLDGDHFFDLIDVGKELRELEAKGKLPQNQREWAPLPY